MKNIFWAFQTHFSIGESIIDPEDGVKAIKDMGYSQVALADTMSVSALISVAKACKKADIGFIPGVTLRVKNPHVEYGYFYPRIYAKNEQGVKAIYKLLSAADSDRGTPFVTAEQFIDALSDDLVVTSGSNMGLFSSAFDDAQRDAMLADIGARYSAPGFVVELAAVATPAYAVQNAYGLLHALHYGNSHCVVPVALYPTALDHDARDVMQAIMARRKIDMGTMRWFPDKSRFIKSAGDVVDEVSNSLQLADKILSGSPGAAWSHVPVVDDSVFTYKWEKSGPALPKMAPDEFEELKTQCKARFASRIMRPVFGYQPDKALLPEYVKRLQYELDILGKMGFSGYFLLVADLVQWSKDNGIIVGPGRGSVGGSLVAFIMGITEVDPIRFNLLFERFINPGRKDLPDADLDFQSERRHEVIKYLESKYGTANVGGISNYNTLQGASAIRDVGKAMLLTEKEYECSKLVPKQHGIPVSLEDAKFMVAEIESYALKNPVVFDVSMRLEGVLRNMSQHAAGVVICHEPLVERAVVISGKDQCINWDKRVAEEQGLVKIDILGLSNLDVIERAFKKIKVDYGKDVDILDIPLDDRKVLDAFGRGETVGVFQFESSGMRKLLKNLAESGPLTFEELSAAMSLYRPGPMDSGMMDDYVSIKKGAQDPYYDHDNMIPALEVTGGVIIYQEQVMQVARDLAGFSLQEADDLRKAMGKKDKEAMAEQRDKWVEGCVSHSGITDHVAGALFDKIEAFAGYGFNRSHSIEYSIISFVSMWLKQYYPLQFYAASMEILGEEKLLGLVEDAAKRGIQVLPPDINRSDDSFSRDGSGKNLLCPFNRLKGLSNNTSNAILAARESGPFKSKADFIARVEKRKCNSRHQEILDRVGAFASVEEDQPASNSATRVRDQLELMPGLVSAKVNVGREVTWDEFSKKQILELVIAPAMEITPAPVNPRSSKKVKVMVITDAVTKQEEKAGTMMHGSNAEYVKNAIAEAGGKWNNGFYYTSLCKVPKKDKKLSGEEQRNWLPLLKKEMEILQPPIIVAMGSEIARMLVPDIKGPITESAGKVVYNKELDANIVIGMTPGMLYVDPSKADIMQRIFEVALELAE